MTSGMLWAGIDIGYERAAVCVTDEQGDVVLGEDLEAEPQAIFDALAVLPVERLKLVGIEAGANSHVARKLRHLGLPIVVLEARKASKVLTLRRHKTDPNDARGLADIVRLGAAIVPGVHEKSAESRKIRAQLSLRQQLIKQRVAGEAAIRCLLREHGGRANGPRTPSTLRSAIEDAIAAIDEAEGVDLRDDVLPLLSVCESIRHYVAALDKRLLALAKAHPICRRFLGVPGIAFVTALSLQRH